MEAVQEEEVKLRGIGFVKEVGFKPGLEERWSYRCTKWWISEAVMGEGIHEQEMEKLVPEWGWRREKGVDSRDKVKHNGRSDQLFLERMMTVPEQQ